MCGGFRSIRSSSDARSWATTRSSSDCWMEKDQEPRSTRDRSMIIAQLWPDRRAIVAHSSQNQEPWSLQLMGHDHRAIVAIKTISWPDQTVRNWCGNLPLKTNVSPLYFSTLDWILKELSDLKERIWVLHDPPMFRLDFDQNRSEIDHEFHRISSDFPLEHWTSARKKSSQIRFNPS